MREVIGANLCRLRKSVEVFTIVADSAPVDRRISHTRMTRSRGPARLHDTREFYPEKAQAFFGFCMAKRTIPNTAKGIPRHVEISATTCRMVETVSSRFCCRFHAKVVPSVTI